MRSIPRKNNATSPIIPRNRRPVLQLTDKECTAVWYPLDRGPKRLVDGDIRRDGFCQCNGLIALAVVCLALEDASYLKECSGWVGGVLNVLDCSG